MFFLVPQLADFLGNKLEKRSRIVSGSRVSKKAEEEEENNFNDDDGLRDRGGSCFSLSLGDPNVDNGLRPSPEGEPHLSCDQGRQPTLGSGLHVRRVRGVGQLRERLAARRRIAGHSLKLAKDEVARHPHGAKEPM